MQDTMIFQRIPAPLLNWYRENKRDLPWRNNPTPYEVWVSEIMLQQTRVEAVKEYYARFIRALPNVEALANCAEEKLLKLWEGLGYYSRVRNMQKTARMLVLEYDGIFPPEPELLRKLPGIGDYTAGAIASIAYGKRCSAVDGNVLRVASRLLEAEMPVSSLAFRKWVAQELGTVYPEEGKACAEFTQSLFELGALICKPKNPNCSICPLAGLCKAYRNGTCLNYPVQLPKREKRVEDVFVFLIQTPEGICIRRREAGVLKGMNEFPSYVTHGESSDDVLYSWGITEYTKRKTQTFTHIFTHIRWNITCVWIQTEVAPFDAYAIEEIRESISLPTAFRQCLEVLEDGI